MFAKIKNMIKKSSKISEVKKKEASKNKSKPKKEAIKPITDTARDAEVSTPKKTANRRKLCPTDKHDCMAYQLTNRMVCMVEEFEQNIKRIENHPNLNAQTKLDIQNYINKNIVTAIWALAPAFDLLGEYPRIKTFKTIYTKSTNKGAPGVLKEIKYI